MRGNLAAVPHHDAGPVEPEKPRRIVTHRLAEKFEADSRGHYKLSHQGDDLIRTQIVDARVSIVAAYADDTGEPYPLAETELHDRTQSVVTHYDLQVSRPGQAVTLPDVPTEDFQKVLWVDRAELSGLPVLTASGQTARQDIATAIKSSTPYAIVPAYGRLGWHYRGGRWMYVHGGGAWDANGAVPDVRVHGDGLATFAMASPPATDDDGRRAFEALFQLFEMGPDRAAAVEIGAAFRASMGRPVGSITYLAINQSGKSGRAAFITQCWAPGVRWRRLPFNAGRDNATPSYIEGVHHTYGDMIVVWDDMAPVGTAMERALYFDRFARSLFNSSSKGRMDRKMNARARLRPRAFGVLTAEDISAVESGQNRTHVITLERGDFDAAAFAAADDGTGPADRSALMSAFIIWWAGRMPAHTQVAEIERGYAADLARATGAPTRYVESVADKAAGLGFALEFAQSRGWVSRARADELWSRGWAGLRESLVTQVRAMSGQAMHERIRDAILDGLASHEAHVLGMDGDVPQADPISLGWDAQGRAQGRQIGWTDCERLFLLPSAAGAFVSTYTARTGTPIEITARAMGEALKAAGLIPGSKERGKDGRPVERSTTPKKILGKKQNVWSLRWNPDAGETTDTDQSAPAAPTPTGWDGQNWTTDPTPTAGQAEGKLDHAAPCVGCGEPSAWQRGGIPLHAMCDAPTPAAPVATAPVQPEIPEVPAEPVLSLAADRDGLYLPGGEVLPAGDALAGMPAFLGRVVELLPDGGSVAITAEVAAGLGYPDAPKVETFAQADRRKSRAKAAPPVEPRAAVEGRAGGWLPADSGIQAWTTWRHPATGVRVHVLVIEWSGGEGAASHVYITPDLSAPAAAHRLAAWREATGHPYVMTAGISGCNMLVVGKHHGRFPLRKWDPPSDCPQGVEKGFDYARPFAEWTEAEKAASHVVGWDMRKAYLAGFAGADFAMDRLEHTGIETGFDKTRAGIWEISGEFKPFPMLPDLRGRAVKVNGKPVPVWVSTPMAEELLNQGMPEEQITDAWVSPKRDGHSARIGRKYAETLRDALKAFGPEETDPDRIALQDALKACYRETYGQIQRSTGSVHRKDWADTIIGFCRASLTRTVIRIGRETGRWPVAMDVDCAYYAASGPDDNPGFDLEDRPGKFDLKSVQTVAEYRAGRGE